MSPAAVPRRLSRRVATLTVIAGLMACVTMLLVVRPSVLPGVPGTIDASGSSFPSGVRPSPSAASESATAGVIGPAIAAASGVLPDSAALSKRIDGVPAHLLGQVSGAVVDLEGGSVLYDEDAATPMVPGSTVKLLTATAVLEALGPWHRFTTRVVSPSPGSIILVGGGDPYLASTAPSASTYPRPVTSDALAANTAAALEADGITSVTLGYDDSLFSGPSWNPAWPKQYRDQVATIGSLWIDQGRDPVTRKFRPDPGLTAARTFAAQLGERGITVTSKDPARLQAPADAGTLAQVQSWPLATIVEQTLLDSNNSAAEVLLRQVALATGHPATFSGGVDAVEQQLTALGVRLDGARLVDGSGLARTDGVTAAQLTTLIRLAASRPELRPLLDGLPVAGVTGTLSYRFHLPGAASGRGVVHAKTGTLTHVSSVAGYISTDDGALLAYAFLINGADPHAKVTKTSVGTNDWEMRNYLDLVGGAIAGCGCS